MDDASQSHASLIADPGDPASPYVFGSARCLSLKIRRGPLLRGGGVTVVRTGVSLVTAMPALVCAAGGTAGTFEEEGVLDNATFRIPLTVLSRPEQRVQVTVPVLNSSAAAQRPSLQSPIRLSLFALPLPGISVNTSAFPEATQDARLHAHRYTHGQIWHILAALPPTARPALNLRLRDGDVTGHAQSLAIRVVLPRLTWQPIPQTQEGRHQVPGSALHGGAVAQTYCALRLSPIWPLHRFDAIRLQRVSCPGVRLHAACHQRLTGPPDREDQLAFIPGTSASLSTRQTRQILVVWTFAPTDPTGREKPPRSLTAQLLIYRHGGEICLDRVPVDSILTPLPLNGFAVRTPRALSFRDASSFWDLPIPGRFYTNPLLESDARYEGIFFPHTDIRWSSRVAIWRQDHQLVLRIFAHSKPFTLAAGTELGTIRFFEVNSLYQESLIRVLPPYQVRAHIRGPNRLRRPALRPQYPPPELRDDVLPSEEDDRWWLRWREQRLAVVAEETSAGTPRPTASDPTAAGAPVGTRRRSLERPPAPAPNSRPLRQLTWQRTRRRPTGSTVTLRPQHDDIVGRPLWATRHEFVSLHYTDQQRGTQELWLSLEPHGPGFAIAHLAAISFTIHPSSLYVPNSFPRGGLGQVVVSVEDARGRFFPLSEDTVIPPAASTLSHLLTWGDDDAYDDYVYAESPQTRGTLEEENREEDADVGD